MAPAIVEPEAPTSSHVAQLKAENVNGGAPASGNETYPNGVLKSTLVRRHKRPPVADDYEYDFAHNTPLPTLDALGVDFDDSDDPAAISIEFLARLEEATKDPEVFAALFIPDGESFAVSD